MSHQVIGRVDGLAVVAYTLPFAVKASFYVVLEYEGEGKEEHTLTCYDARRLAQFLLDAVGTLERENPPALIGG